MSDAPKRMPSDLWEALRAFRMNPDVGAKELPVYLLLLQALGELTSTAVSFPHQGLKQLVEFFDSGLACLSPNVLKSAMYANYLRFYRRSRN